MYHKKFKYNTKIMLYLSPLLTSFTWCSMCTMLCTITCNHLVVTAVPANRKRCLQYVITRLHAQQYSLDFFPLVFHGHLGFDILDELILSHLTRSMEEIFHHVEEPWVLGCRHILEVIWHFMKSTSRRHGRCPQDALRNVTSESAEIVHGDKSGWQTV